MNKIVIYIITLILVLALLLFTCTYQVRFSEAAVVTTFGKAAGNAQVTEPGLHWKWPYPIQAVRKYDTRIRVLESRIETVQTKDYQLVNVQVFLSWRIGNVLDYFLSVSNDAKAESLLQNRLRSSQSIFSQYDFSELLALQGGEGKIGAVEDGMLTVLLTPGDDNPGVGVYGIEPIAIGVSRFILPESTSVAVKERMKQTRLTMAAEVSSSGAAEASRIITEARTASEKIRQFASRLAAGIKSVGEEQAAVYLAEQAAVDENFAIFLYQLDALEDLLHKNSTIIMPTSWPLELLEGPPTLEDTQTGATNISTDNVTVANTGKSG